MSSVCIAFLKLNKLPRESNENLREVKPLAKSAVPSLRGMEWRRTVKGGNTEG